MNIYITQNIYGWKCYLVVKITAFVYKFQALLRFRHNRIAYLCRFYFVDTATVNTSFI